MTVFICIREKVLFLWPHVLLLPKFIFLNLHLFIFYLYCKHVVTLGRNIEYCTSKTMASNSLLDKEEDYYSWNVPSIIEIGRTRVRCYKYAQLYNN